MDKAYFEEGEINSEDFEIEKEMLKEENKKQNIFQKLKRYMNGGILEKY